MPLIVEDGTGRSDADSYVALVYAAAYHTAMGNPAWSAADPAVQESALRRATQYLDTRYRFAGEQLTTAQALAWPRDVAPWPVKRVMDACCELALRALSGPLYSDQDASAVTRETVGPITVEYANPQDGGQVRFAVVDDMLRSLTAGGGRMSLRIERAS